jgi:DNA repair protein RadC
MLRKLRAASVIELSAQYGMSRREAVRTAAALELGRRIECLPLCRTLTLWSAADVYAHAGYLGLPDLPVERLMVMLLDGKNRVQDTVLVSQGTINGAMVHPREVFAPAISGRAAAIVLVHNHPSGDPSPSGPDKEITERLVKASAVLGIEILDHVVVGRNGYYSFKELGILPNAGSVSDPWYL